MDCRRVYVIRISRLRVVCFPAIVEKVERGMKGLSLFQIARLALRCLTRPQSMNATEFSWHDIPAVECSIRHLGVHRVLPQKRSPDFTFSSTCPHWHSSPTEKSS